MPPPKRDANVMEVAAVFATIRAIKSDNDNWFFNAISVASYPTPKTWGKKTAIAPTINPPTAGRIHRGMMIERAT